MINRSAGAGGAGATASTVKKGGERVGFTTYFTGIVHGLQPDALYVVIPALALPTKLAAVSFITMFVIGTCAAMGGYTLLIGERIPAHANCLSLAPGVTDVALVCLVCDVCRHNLEGAHQGAALAAVAPFFHRLRICHSVRRAHAAGWPRRPCALLLMITYFF